MQLKSSFAAIKARKRELGFPYRDYHRRNGCVFIHIPKAAGTSILHALGKKGGGRDHLPWYVYYTANPVYFRCAFKFAFVRNPWSRMLSAYEYLKGGGNHKADLETQKRISRYQDFDDFVVNGLALGDFRSHLMFIPQSEFVVNGDGKLAVDFLGRYETLGDDYLVVAERLNLKKELAECNRGPLCFVDYRKFYQCGRSVEVIYDIYRQDVAFFGYHF